MFISFPSSEVGNPGAEGVLEGLDFFVEQSRFVEFAGEFAGEIAGGADGAHPNVGVGVFQGVGEGDDGSEGDFLELEAGELAGLIGLFGQFLAEFFVFKPAVEGAAANPGHAGGGGYRVGAGQDGNSGALAGGEGFSLTGVGILCSMGILGHCVPWRLSGDLNLGSRWGSLWVALGFRWGETGRGETGRW